MDAVLYIYDWDCRDVSGKCELLGWGKTTDSAATHLARVPFHPFFFIEIPRKKRGSAASQKSFMYAVIEALKGSKKELCRIVHRKPFVGFRGGLELPFVQVVFESLEHRKKAKYVCGRNQWPTYEASCDTLLKFFHVQDLDPVGWTQFKAPLACVTETSRISKEGVVEFKCNFRNVSMHPTMMDKPPLVVASWDIECMGTRGFPKGSNPDDFIIMIGTSYRLPGGGTRDTAHHLGPCDPVDGCDTYCYGTENELVQAWIQELYDMHVDILLGFNTWGFDHKYVEDRTMVLIDFETGDSLIDMTALGKLKSGGGEMVEKTLASAAFGQNSYSFHSSPGMVPMDALMIYRKELPKMESYTLRALSDAFLDGISKIDLPAAELFQKYTTGDPAERALVVEYCVRDCKLPLMLFDKLHTLTNQLEMCKCVCVPLTTLNTRGMQIRCYSQLLKRTRGAGYLVPDDVPCADASSFVGATVLEAQVGAYMHDIVSCLDFSSLYPSIMRAHCMCPSTLVLDKAYENLDGVEYYRVDISPGNTVSFAQTPDAVVPALLNDLAAWRSQAKKDMAMAKAGGDTFMASLYNAKQLAFKVASNSMYGFFGATKGMMPLLQLASAVTATGRNMIYHTKRICEEKGHRVVYGDSVAAYTPIYVREKGGDMQITTFEALSRRVKWMTRDDGKEYGTVPGLQTWSDSGWTDVHMIIRHRHTDDLIRVATHTGVVDVTAHHSLLLPNGHVVKPSEVSVGTQLLHAPLPRFQARGTSMQQDRDMARIVGFFIGDGSCGVYKCPSGLKASWALNNSNHSLLKQYKTLVERTFPSLKWNIYDTKASSGVYKLSPSLSISTFVSEWREMCYDGKSKIIPFFIHQADHNIKEEFMKGFYDADGIKCDNMRFDQKNHITAAHFFHILEIMGYKTSVSTRQDKKDIFRITGTYSYQRKPAASVKKTYQIPYSGYVYDFTTANHHFSAGVGNLVVHNTDSVMVILDLGQDNRVNLALHIQEAKDLSEEITKTFKRPNELEYEKVYWPYLLYSKKRYAGRMFEFDPNTFSKIDIKGLQVVRRDSAPIVRETCSRILDILMHDRSFDKALAFAHDQIMDLVRGKVPWSKLIVSKAVRGDYKNPNALPHVVVANKRRARGTPPLVGERVPYIFVIRHDHADEIMASRAEDPAYAEEHKMDVDILYYVRNQMVQPIATMLGLEIPNCSVALLSRDDIANAMVDLQTSEIHRIKECKRLKKLKADKQSQITSFFSKKSR